MKLRARPLKSGKVSWEIDLGRINGRRCRRLFQSKAKAVEALSAAKNQARLTGKNSLAGVPPEIDKWLKRIALEGVTLEDVVKFYLQHKVASTKSPAEILPLYAAEMTRLKRSVKHIRETEATLRRFQVLYPSFEDVKRETIEHFITGTGWGTSAQRRFVVMLKAFCEFSYVRGFLAVNPLADSRNTVKVAKTQGAEVLSLGVNEVRNIVILARLPEYQSILGWLSLALFAGVRPEEINRTDRHLLALEVGLFRVTAKNSKTAKTRVIELPEVCLAYLKEWCAVVPETARFVEKSHREKWDKLRKEAGLYQNWVPDVLRHTFASMHYAMHQNASLLKALMGHSQNENTLFQHYRAVQTVTGETITRAMAEEFWSLVPEKL
jgi:integrase